MRELVVENQKILVIPQNYKFVNHGVVKSVSAGEFVLELDYEPDGILENTYCEFYTQTSHGKLHFDSYAKEINGKTLLIASPAKHKFLQRRQYTRIKYMTDLDMTYENKSYKISTLDISAGGMKFRTSENINIEASYALALPLTDNASIGCEFQPIRIEKKDGGYMVSGQFVFKTTADRMFVTQYCAKRSVEIKNK